MLKSGLLASALLSRVGAASYPNTIHVSQAVGNGTNGETIGVPACEALRDAGLGDRLLFPYDAAYEPQIETWWDLGARLRPYCLVLPQNSAEVSTALTALLAANNASAGAWHVAVRSGGHSSSPGFNNIDLGVTIDLSHLNGTAYDGATGIARIDTGGRWRDVYAALDAQGVAAAGGRDGDVGVGGFLLGGGISYFSGEVGFGCDSVVNFEVVLASGEVVNANSTVNADLWRALKGGGSNFGIVTRFDMKTTPAGDFYYELRYVSGNYSDTVVDAVVGVADQDQSLADNAIVSFFAHDTSVSPDVYTVNIYVNTKGNDSVATAYDQIRAPPAMKNVSSHQSMAEIAATQGVSGGTRGSEGTITFYNDPRILRRCVELHAELVDSLTQSLGADSFQTEWFLQPVSSYMAELGQQQGGNMLGMDRVRHNMVVLTAGVAVNSDQSAYAVAQAELVNMIAQARDCSKQMDGEVDFVYLNYAHPSQDPLSSYGQDNVQHIREVAAKYDPTGVFQTLVPGGFKISRIE